MSESIDTEAIRATKLQHVEAAVEQLERFVEIGRAHPGRPLIADVIRENEYRPDRTATDFGAGVAMGAMTATDRAIAAVQGLLGDTDGDR